MTVDLNLVVLAAQALNVSVREIAGQVTTAV